MAETQRPKRICYCRAKHVTVMYTVYCILYTVVNIVQFQTTDPSHLLGSQSEVLVLGVALAALKVPEDDPHGVVPCVTTSR